MPLALRVAAWCWDLGPSSTTGEHGASRSHSEPQFPHLEKGADEVTLFRVTANTVFMLRTSTRLGLLEGLDKPQLLVSAGKP